MLLPLLKNLNMFGVHTTPSGTGKNRTGVFVEKQPKSVIINANRQGQFK